jgi:hypothetical protein
MDGLNILLMPYLDLHLRLHGSLYCVTFQKQILWLIEVMLFVAALLVFSEKVFGCCRASCKSQVIEAHI